MLKLSSLKIQPSRFVLLLNILFSFAPGLLSGQSTQQDDTLKIEEVVITRKQISSEQPGFKFYSIDTDLLKSYDHFSLNDVLRDATPLFMKEYGAGLTATSSFRGTSAGHTQVTWNGININDPMLGQTDFSLIPSGMIDNVIVSFGGASMDLGSGAIGGIINLGNEPSWRKETVILVAPGLGSYGRYNGLIKASTGNEKFQSVTKAFLNIAENNFIFLDTEMAVPEWKYREHNKTSQRSIMQEFYMRKSADVLSARFWYQSTSRNLPGSILYGYSGEKQYDESLRSLITCDAVRGKMEFFSSAAWMLTDMRYSSFWDTTGSDNKVNTFILKGGMNLLLSGATTVKIVLNDELNLVESNYYSGNINHNNASLTISAERKKGKWFGAALLLRETLDDKSFLVPDFSAGFELRTIRGEEHYIKLNLSRNSKIPSLNDRFWNPGGNPDLKNEYAYSLESGYKLSHTMGSRFKISSELNYFNNHIRNMIQWYPETEFIWVAGNIGSVNTSGFETSASLGYTANKFSAGWDAAYSFTRARDISTEGTSDKQLAYIPKHLANSTLQISYRNFYSTLVTNFTNRIYTSSDNTGYIDGYAVNSLTGGYKLNFRGNSADIRLKADNIFNAAYQTIAYYPQPGRSWLFVLSLRFKV
ncbi:MAG: TonB-dependent receptor [Bacteroidales bacterium]|jgi:iron complex outermembrane receptor protein|nr:TonB-dependent receptor [Bacteroidales bacterium]